MKLFARITSEHGWELGREYTLDGSGWYEIEREPVFGERLVYDAEKDCINIVPWEKTYEETSAEQKAAEDAALMKADTIRTLQATIAQWETQGQAALTKIAELEARTAKIEEAKG